MYSVNRLEPMAKTMLRRFDLSCFPIFLLTGAVDLIFPMSKFTHHVRARENPGRHATSHVVFLKES